MFGRPPGHADGSNPEIYYVDMLRDRLEKAHAFARNCLQKSTKRQKRTYEHIKVADNKLKHGDLAVQSN
jgi:hypothetical protein